MSSGGHSCSRCAGDTGGRLDSGSGGRRRNVFRATPECFQRGRLPSTNPTKGLDESAHSEQRGGTVDHIDPQGGHLVMPVEDFAHDPGRPETRWSEHLDDRRRADKLTEPTYSARRPLNGASVAPESTGPIGSVSVDNTTAAFCAARLPLTVNAGTQPTRKRLGSVSTRAALASTAPGSAR